MTTKGWLRRMFLPDRRRHAAQACHDARCVTHLELTPPEHDQDLDAAKERVAYIERKLIQEERRWSVQLENDVLHRRGDP